MSRPLPWFVLLFPLAAAPASACINSYDEQLLYFRTVGDDAGLRRTIAEIEAQHAKTPTLENGNDLAVARMIMGRYPEAVVLLRAVEQQYPGKAIVAANLGTALELSGADEEALRWIKEGVWRDPSEHEGTEWLHVLILEAKIAMARDPKRLEKHGVLELDFGSAPRPKMPVIATFRKWGNSRDVKDIARAIAYQLQERTKFVKPREPIVADLYLTLANLGYAYFLDTHDPKAATSEIKGYYELAQRYGANPDLIQARVRSFGQDTAQTAIRKP